MSITYWKLGKKAIAAFGSEKEAQRKLDEEKDVFELGVDNKIIKVKKADVTIYTERK